MKINIQSLGCRLNRAEMESVTTELRERGHSMTTCEEADFIIINSCVVTGASERKTRQLMYQALRRLGNVSSDKRIIVTGCAVGRTPVMDGIIFVDNDHKHLIPELIENPGYIAGMDKDNASRFCYRVPVKGSRTRAHLKIQDGCDKFCSYCIIPAVRGIPQSKPIESVCDEFKMLVDSGYKEIVLTGVMIGNYRSGTDDLTTLLSRLIKTEGNYRVHLSSMNPDSINPSMIEILMDRKVVKHLHLSLQSGSDTILKAMNRHYGVREYLDIVQKIRRQMPFFNLTTDLIVGFPGESVIAFEQSLALAAEVEFSHIHIFRYSRRPGTAAELMDDDVPDSVKTERRMRAMELSSKQKAEYYKNFENRVSTIISESYKNGYTSGFNEFYVPVIVEKRLMKNEFFDVITCYDPARRTLKGMINDCLTDTPDGRQVP